MASATSFRGSFDFFFSLSHSSRIDHSYPQQEKEGRSWKKERERAGSIFTSLHVCVLCECVYIYLCPAPLAAQMYTLGNKRDLDVDILEYIHTQKDLLTFNYPTGEQMV